MYAKIENGELVFPPHNDGNKINVHLNPVWLAENGYTDMSQEEIDDIIKRKEQEEEEKQEEEQNIFSKLSIRRAMRNLGIEERLNDIINSSDTFKSDWTDAQEINLNDPIFISALQSGGITEYDIEMIKEEINKNSEQL